VVSVVWLFALVRRNVGVDDARSKDRMTKYLSNYVATRRDLGEGSRTTQRIYGEGAQSVRVLMKEEIGVSLRY
jgi:hypothetical protein